MKLIKPSFEIIPQEATLEGLYKHIEKAGRVCYKSEDRITEGSAKKFVDAMVKSGHGAMLEHGTVYLRYYHAVYEDSKLTELFKNNPYSHVHTVYMGDCVPTVGDFITTNWRVIVENNLYDRILGFMCEPTEHHERRVTVKFICDRAVSHQLVRSRSMSFAQESQRYCNYSKDKHNNEVTFIIPSWAEDRVEMFIDNPGITAEFSYDYTEGEEHVSSVAEWFEACELSERHYLNLLNKGCTPQEARTVLLNSAKTEVVMTGFVSDWIHFFGLRADGVTGKPHPDMEALAKPLKEEFLKRGYI